MNNPHNSYTTTNDSGHRLYTNSVQLVQYMKIKINQVVARFIGKFRYSYMYFLFNNCKYINLYFKCYDIWSIRIHCRGLWSGNYFIAVIFLYILYICILRNLMFCLNIYSVIVLILECLTWITVIINWSTIMSKWIQRHSNSKHELQLTWTNFTALEIHLKEVRL